MSDGARKQICETRTISEREYKVTSGPLRVDSNRYTQSVSVAILDDHEMLFEFTISM